MRAADIASLIQAAMPEAEVEVRGEDGAHFEARIVSEQFAGKSQVQRHQLVYAALGGKMGAEIHALSMQTFTPEQWRERQARQIH